MRTRTLSKLIASARGIEDMGAYSRFKLSSPQVLADTAKEMLAITPPSFGACAMLSAGWAAWLRDKHGIPAIAVAGDLNIQGTKVFKCVENLPEAGKSGRVISKRWDGHCWLEIDGYIGDLSIFRTAYTIEGPSVLKQFVLKSFGKGRGALLCSASQLHSLGMSYEPKYVLNDLQVNGLVAGLGAQIAGGI